MKERADKSRAPLQKRGSISRHARGPGGGFSVNFRCYARLGKKFVTVCTYIFA